MIEVPKNRFKAALQAGETQIGLWLSIPCAVTAEALSLVGYDWLLFDSEHAPVEVAQLQGLLQAASAGASALCARPAWNDKVLIKKTLDIGAQTVLVPFVQTAEEAAAAVAATRYPPQGIRGVAGATRASRYGMAPDYLHQANNEICTLVQIETGDALDRLEQISTVEGVDGVFIGPSDLSASMGYIGQSGSDVVQGAVKEAAERILKVGSVPGILATNVNDAKRYLSWGFRFVAISVDLGLLLGAARTSLHDIRNH